MTNPNRRGPDLVPIIVLLAIVAVVGGGLWLLPYFQSVAQHQNCVAIGRTDCEVSMSVMFQMAADWQLSYVKKDRWKRRFIPRTMCAPTRFS